MDKEKRTIILHSSTGLQDNIFAPNARDGCNEPQICLRNKLHEYGWHLRTADDVSLLNCAWVIFYDAMSVIPYAGWRGIARKFRAKFRRHPLIRPLYEECIAAGMADKMVLILNEPPAVSPENWSPALHDRFKVIFTWNDELVDNRKYFKFFFPQPTSFPETPSVPFEKRRLLVNISMNKKSRHPHELYSKRKKSIEYFEQFHLAEFSLYGVGWNRSAGIGEKLCPWMVKRYKSYAGEIKRKADVLPFYRFSLCYENIDNSPGWISEKIFDSMRCGCVPIYLGAPNVEQFIDRDAFIDRRHFASDPELAKYLLSVTRQRFDGYLSAMDAFLKSKRFAQFLGSTYADTIIRVLGIEK